MKLFELYISRKFISLIIILTLGTLVLLGLVDYIANITMFSVLNSTEILYFYFLKSVSLLSFVLPIAVFLSAAMTTKKLSDNNEVTAFMSLGGSIRSLIKPFLIYAIFICKIVALLEFFLIPMANKTKTEFEEKHALKHPLGKEKESSVYLKVSDKNFMMIDYYDLEKDVGKNVTIDEIENNTLKSRIQAEKIEWEEEEYDEEEENEKEGCWVLKNWKKINYEKNNNITSQGFDMVLENLKIKPDVLWMKLNLKNKITMPTLTEYIDVMKEQGLAHVEDFKTEQARRIKSIFIILIFVLLGVFTFIQGNNRRKRGNKLIKLIIILYVIKSSFIPTKTIFFLNLNTYVLTFLTLFVDFLLLFYLYKKAK